MYKDCGQFSEDLQRVWANCYLYNGTDRNTPVVATARTLETIASQLVAEIPERLERAKQVNLCQQRIPS